MQRLLDVSVVGGSPAVLCLCLAACVFVVVALGVFSGRLLEDTLCGLATGAAVFAQAEEVLNREGSHCCCFARIEIRVDNESIRVSCTELNVGLLQLLAFFYTTTSQAQPAINANAQVSE